MVMDKGLSIQEVEQFMSVGKPHTDLLKLGFGTSYVTPNLREKINAGMLVKVTIDVISEDAVILENNLEKLGGER